MRRRRSVTNKHTATKKPKGFVGPDPTPPQLASFAAACPESRFGVRCEKGELSFCCDSDVVPDYCSAKRMEANVTVLSL